MRYSTALLASLQIAGLAQASPILSSRDAVAPADSQAIEVRSPEDISTPDLDEIVNLEVRGIEKRSTDITLSANTGYYKRVAYKGAVILLHLFYDLAVNHVVFYWTIDGTTPAPGSISLGFEDLVGGAGFPIREYSHDTRYNLGSAMRPGDTIKVTP
ncbi:hypothetical protein IWW34DRAFT_766819 [Fusarium oxysporum f. sp. albedinis]|nr:hypothetical protein IWW34DRAFT_776240 [Fusarium oxysporum f. sp. albedinis]KAI3571939.1 hypothetical protein IWW34DRAFT_766819 [Fusarium oxysporum f. sp. albedinis]KAJ0128781.1 hypothetical protein HZ326_28123 [Fusarium oxysporum f. sp. albedinis]KAK2468584.1 hypothetical protein H9L39_19743 [Fusarium oxysporum f. sp. albedinis]KAK2469944.1 hypothetical protein H9L39_18408 [Fusarium oxysporum f. sp. albedinis]